MKALLLLCFLVIATSAPAEVYRWTDATGKIHYGDKKPKAESENITEQVKKTNIDTSAAEHKKFEALFRKENEADREYQRQKNQPNPALLERCEEAKDYLKKLNGRVYFLDDEGKEVRVTEEERKKYAQQLEQTIGNNCPP